MATLSLDLRERIVSAYDKGEGTRDEIARRFRVSLGMVKKLLQQRRKTGDIKPRHHLAGRKKLIVAQHRIAIRQQLKRKPDMTLAELREALSLKCTLPAIHYVLVDMGLTYKKRRSVQPSRTGRTSAKRVAAGSAGKAG
jgi:transposase